MLRKDVKGWLRRVKRDRHWLAGQCYVSKATVDCWLSTVRPIPAAKQALLRRIMAEDCRPSAAAFPQRHIVQPVVSLDQFRRFSEAALACGQTLEQWVKARIKACAGPPNVQVSQSETKPATQEYQ